MSDVPAVELQHVTKLYRGGVKAVDHYGLSEVQGPGVGGECDVAQAGLHGWEPVPAAAAMPAPRQLGG